MAQSPITPILALSGVAYVNNWYNTKNALDVKPLLFGALAGLILELVAAIPGAEPAATALGWTAFVGMLIAPVQNPSPAQNFLKLSGSA
jgi:uncharacterized YccA/Bax inhibitor family protein